MSVPCRRTCRLTARFPLSPKLYLPLRAEVAGWLAQGTFLAQDSVSGAPEGAAQRHVYCLLDVVYMPKREAGDIADSWYSHVSLFPHLPSHRQDQAASVPPLLFPCLIVMYPPSVEPATSRVKRKSSTMARTLFLIHRLRSVLPFCLPWESSDM